MKTDMVQQYYKCPTTGVEMNFRKDMDWGWCISFPHGHKGHRAMRDAGLEIPWPKLSDSDQKVVDANYQKLHEMMEKENE